MPVSVSHAQFLNYIFVGVLIAPAEKVTIDADKNRVRITFS